MSWVWRGPGGSKVRAGEARHLRLLFFHSALTWKGPVPLLETRLAGETGANCDRDMSMKERLGRVTGIAGIRVLEEVPLGRGKEEYMKLGGWRAQETREEPAWLKPMC